MLAAQQLAPVGAPKLHSHSSRSRSRSMSRTVARLVASAAGGAAGCAKTHGYRRRRMLFAGLAGLAGVALVGPALADDEEDESIVLVPVLPWDGSKTIEPPPEVDNEGIMNLRVVLMQREVLSDAVSGLELVSSAAPPPEFRVRLREAALQLTEALPNVTAAFGLDDHAASEALASLKIGASLLGDAEEAEPTFLEVSAPAAGDDALSDGRPRLAASATFDALRFLRQAQGQIDDVLQSVPTTAKVYANAYRGVLPSA